MSRKGTDRRARERRASNDVPRRTRRSRSTAGAKKSGLRPPVSVNAFFLLSLQVAPDALLLRLAAPRVARAAPGQFAMLRVPERADLLLPRPLSFLDANPRSGEVAFLIRTRGAGTRHLMGLQMGPELAVWGPLGTRFTPLNSASVLMIAGGVGVAPLVFLARRLRRRRCRITFVFGARTASALYMGNLVRKFAHTPLLATEDGSEGQKATAVELLVQLLDPSGGPGRKFDFAYLCGPPPMLEAAAPVLAAASIPSEASFESRMLCGLGVCGCCTVEVPEAGADGRNRRVRLCRDGPVLRLT